METPILQLIAYVSLTLGSVIVASVSLFVAYRQNRGWKPVLIVTTRGSGLIMPDPKSLEFNKEFQLSHIGFEVWNRRKYPILLRTVEIKFHEREPVSTAMPGYEPSKDWLIGLTSMSCTFGAKSILLPASEHMEFRATAPFKVSDKDLITDRIDVRVYYFDPVRDKHFIITVPGSFRKEAKLAPFRT